MRTKLKICGITNLEDARYCAAAGVDFIGFIMHPASPRYIAPEVARDINEWVVGPLAVGVFVDEDPDTINALAELVGLELVQLHGNESPDTCHRIRVPVIKVIGVSTDDTEARIEDSVRRFADHADYLLFDSRVDGRTGGTGQRFDWALVSGVARRHKVFLAGGINADNAAEAVETVQPFALDVASGAEEKPGKKDFDRISRLVDLIAGLETAS